MSRDSGIAARTAEIRAELQRRLADLNGLAADQPSSDWERRPDLADQSSDATASALAAAQSQTIFELREQVQRALEALDEGEYGHCVECGRPISRARLEAMPWSLTCIRCAEEEARQRTWE